MSIVNRPSKTLRSIVLASLMLFATVTNQEKANALVGALTANPFVAFAGGLLAGGTLIATGVVLSDPDRNVDEDTMVRIKIGIGAAVLVGLILLPVQAEGTVAIDVSALNENPLFKNAELSSVELDQLSREEIFVNATLEDVYHKMISENNSTPEFARAELLKHQADLSPDAFNGLVKILNYSARSYFNLKSH